MPNKIGRSTQIQVVDNSKWWRGPTTFERNQWQSLLRIALKVKIKSKQEQGSSAFREALPILQHLSEKSAIAQS
jgi:hypothetical protein